jgi:8-oxo-dGTP pyrophosphatase MutT (NUDIX family)
MFVLSERDSERTGRLHKDAMLRHLYAARGFDPALHVRLECAGARIGWVPRAHVAHLLAAGCAFEADRNALHVSRSLKSAEARTAAVDEAVSRLRDEGKIKGWRDERYAVSAAFDAAPLFHIERAAARYLGVTTYAAHVNAYCADRMWLARRAMTKPIDPGMLDNLVGGGMSAGIAPLETVVREAREEAGIDAALAGRAVPAGTVRLLREVPEGVQSEVIFVHDLELPPEFAPSNQDGEVSEFQCGSLPQIMAMMKSGDDITLEAALVILSFLLRRGQIELDPAAIAEIIEFDER